MTKAAKKHFDENLRKGIWGIFWREIDKDASHAQTNEHLKKFLTESEIDILEKRLAALYWLDQGGSLRETSKKSGLAKKAVVAVKHGFRKPVPRFARTEKNINSEKRFRRSGMRVFPSLVSDKLINDLRRRRRPR